MELIKTFEIKNKLACMRVLPPSSFGLQQNLNPEFILKKTPGSQRQKPAGYLDPGMSQREPFDCQDGRHRCP